MFRLKNSLQVVSRRFTAALALAAALVCLPLVLPATNPLVGVDWFERQIGDGVVWRQYEFADLFGAQQHISYIEADLDNPNVVVELPYLASGIQRTSTMAPAQFPAALGAVNGTYFNTSDPGHNTYLRINSTVIPHKERTKSLWGHHGGFSKDSLNNWSILEIPGTTADSWENNTTHPTIMANGPIIVWEGAVAYTHIAKISSTNTHCTSRHNRTAVGLTNDNKLILLTTDGRTDRGLGTTCEETAQILIWLGVVEALNMDGGGTTTMWIKGEPNSGVVNYPSDGSGERGTPNAIAVVAPVATPAPWDGQLLSVSYTQTVEPNQTQTVTFTYKNIGAETWTQANTKLVTSRPAERSSDFYQVGWVSPSQPALMTQASVAPNSNATFSFQITSPETTTPLLLYEHFMLTQEGVGRIGPSDARARLKLAVIPPIPDGEVFLVEPRSGGQNYTSYSDTSFSNSTANCTAPGVTPGIGTRWVSTFYSVVGLKEATWRPNFPSTGDYHVSVAWPEAGSNRRDNITYYVDHQDGRDTILLNQGSQGDKWYPLGIFTFDAGLSDDGRIVMSNINANVSGNMWAGPVRFVRLESNVADWQLFQ